jgi:nicotinamidase-related amidase
MSTIPDLTLVPTRTALAIVDMQNDFVRSGAPMEVPTARDTIGAQKDLIRAARELGMPVVFTRFLAGPQPSLVWRWSPRLAPPDCACWKGVYRTYQDVEGERDGSAVIDELDVRPDDIVIDKYGYDAFHETYLAAALRAHGRDTVVVAGTVTQICVSDTVRGAFHRGFGVVVAADGVSSYDEELHRTTLRGVEMKYGRVAPSDVVIAELRGAR